MGPALIPPSHPSPTQIRKEEKEKGEEEEKRGWFYTKLVLTLRISLKFAITFKKS